MTFQIEKQKQLGEDADIVCILLHIDGTPLESFNGKSCQPVCLSIGNIQVGINSRDNDSMILLGYLPNIKDLFSIKTEFFRTHLRKSLFAALKLMLEPLPNPVQSIPGILHEKMFK